MNKHNVVGIIFVFAFIYLLINKLFFLLIPLAIIYFTITFCGSFMISLNYYLHSITSIPNSNKIFLTFDDGPDAIYTPKILDLLKKYQCTATFFCIGHKIKNNEDLLLRMDVEGHTIANHTWSHAVWFDLYKSTRMQEEISATQTEIYKAIRKIPILFRPPYGVTNPMLAKAIKNTKVISIAWNIRTFDTASFLKVKAIISNIKSKLAVNSIILLHDNQEKTVLLLEEIILNCQKKGLQIGNIDDYIKCYKSID